MQMIKMGNSYLAAIYIPKLSDETEHFYTTPTDSLQVGVFNRQGGYYARQHRHTELVKEYKGSQEVIIVIEGVLIVTLYDDLENHISVLEMHKNEILIIRKGWHNARVGKDGCQFLEVKTGPYNQATDKIYRGEE